MVGDEHLVLSKVYFKISSPKNNMPRARLELPSPDWKSRPLTSNAPVLASFVLLRRVWLLQSLDLWVLNNIINKKKTITCTFHYLELMNIHKVTESITINISIT